MKKKETAGKCVDKRNVFLALAIVNNANPNGDPLANNYPRETVAGHGKMSAVSIKRKLRNRMQDEGHDIFIVSDDRADDGINNIYDRIMSNADVAEAVKSRNEEEIKKAMLSNFIDCRAFGALIAVKAKPSDKSGLSVGIRGAVTIQDAFSYMPIMVQEDQITKSVNASEKEGRSSDRFGTKYSVDHGLYLIKGSVNPFYARKNGFTNEDLEALKNALLTLYENDESAARPAGSMSIAKVFWWEGDITNSGMSRLYDSIKISIKEGVANPSSIDDYVISVDPLVGAEEIQPPLVLG